MPLADRYDDRTHFIFELLQNAEDALDKHGAWNGPRRVTFNLSPGLLSPWALTLIGIDPGLLSGTDPPNLGDCAGLLWSQGSARRLGLNRGRDGSVSSRSRRLKMNSRLFRAALSTFCSSPTLRPRGGAWLAC